MGPKPKRKRKLSFQQRRLLSEALSGRHKTIASAGEAAGYSGTAAHRALRNLQGTISEIMDQAGFSDAHLVQNCLGPLLNASHVKVFQHRGKIKYSKPLTNDDIRLRALDVALRIKGKYAPLAAEQSKKDTVEVLVLDCPRPKRDPPPPTVIELAQPAPSQNALPQPGSSASQQPTNVLPPNGNGSNGAKV